MSQANVLKGTDHRL